MCHVSFTAVYEYVVFTHPNLTLNHFFFFFYCKAFLFYMDLLKHKKVFPLILQ